MYTQPCHAAVPAMKPSLLIELTVNESVEHVETGSWLVVGHHVATFRYWILLAQNIITTRNQTYGE